MLIFQKPTPEKSLTKFEAVWDNVKNGKANETEKQDFVKSLISVEGKSTLKKEKKAVLDSAVTWTVHSMVGDSEGVLLSSYINTLKDTREKLVKADNEEYTKLQSELVLTKASINSMLDKKIGIEATSVEAALLPYCLTAQCKELSDECKASLPEIMKLYLTHNQSFLTDSKFLGFPFHYFYTAEFLLILFVCLCLIYSMRITQLQKKFSIKEG